MKSKLRDRAMIDTQFFEGSVKHGSCWRLLRYIVAISGVFICNCSYLLLMVLYIYTCMFWVKIPVPWIQWDIDYPLGDYDNKP